MELSLGLQVLVTGNFMEKYIADITKADKIIKKRHRYACGLETDDANLKDGRASFFFNSPDSQNGELYYELKNLGWRHSKFEAEYYWTLKKDKYVLTYCEGDLYLKKEYDCDTCKDTGEVGTMEQVYAGEPHMASVGTGVCPDCQSNEPDDFSGATDGDR